MIAADGREQSDILVINVAGYFLKMNITLTSHISKRWLAPRSHRKVKRRDEGWTQIFEVDAENRTAP